MKLNVDKPEPNLPNDRTDSELEMPTSCITLHAYKEPRRTWPMTDTLEPMEAKLRIDMFEPTVNASRTEIRLDNRTIVRTLMELPIVMAHINDICDEEREKEGNDREELMITRSITDTLPMSSPQPATDNVPPQFPPRTDSAEDRRTNDLTLILEPMLRKSNTDSVEPHLANERNDNELPSSVASITVRLHTPPGIRNVPTHEMLEPMEMSERMEMDEPSEAKSSTDNAEPHRTCERIDTAEPMATNCKAEHVRPTRAKERIDNDEPKCTKLITDIDFADLIADMMDTDDAKLRQSNMLMRAPTVANCLEPDR
jgi:hypothetical protein